LPRRPDSPKSIALAELPVAASGRADEAAEREMEAVQTVIGAARTIRSEREVHPGAQVPLVLRSDDEGLRRLLEEERTAIAALVKAEVTIEPSGGERPAGAALSAAAGVEVLVLLKGIV